MKDKFPGYFPLSEESLEDAWKQGLVSLDASILLDFYRYSDETRADLVNLLKNFGPRLWIANRAVEEFLKNREGVIGQQVKAYEDMRSNCKKIEQNFRSARGHPFVSPELLQKLSKTFAQLDDDLNSRMEKFRSLSKSDSIQAEISELVAGKIGDGFTPERLRTVYAEGEARYKNRTPPGYSDDAKPADEKYGDLIIWFELIDIAKSKHKAVIFVTADQKKDWWWKVGGNTVARPELFAEMRRAANQDFLIYSLGDFLQIGKKKFAQHIKDDAIKEVREAARLEEIIKSNWDSVFDDIRRRRNRESGLLKLLDSAQGLAGLSDSELRDWLGEVFERRMRDQQKNPALDAYRKLLRTLEEPKASDASNTPERSE